MRDYTERRYTVDCWQRSGGSTCCSCGRAQKRTCESVTPVGMHVELRHALYRLIVGGRGPEGPEVRRGPPHPHAHPSAVSGTARGWQRPTRYAGPVRARELVQRAPDPPAVTPSPGATRPRTADRVPGTHTSAHTGRRRAATRARRRMRPDRVCGPWCWSAVPVACAVCGARGPVFPNLRETAPCAVEKRPRRARSHVAHVNACHDSAIWQCVVLL